MQQEIFHYAIILLIMYGIYKSRHDTLHYDTVSANEPFSTKKWIINSSVELILSILLYVGYIMGIDLSEVMPESQVAGFMGAVAIGAGIPNVSSRILMPLLAPIFKIKTPRKKLREVVNLKTDVLDALIEDKKPE